MKQKKVYIIQREWFILIYNAFAWSVHVTGILNCATVSAMDLFGSFAEKRGKNLLENENAFRLAVFEVMLVGEEIFMLKAFSPGKALEDFSFDFSSTYFYLIIGVFLHVWNFPL